MQTERPKEVSVAALVTAYSPNGFAQQVLDRLLGGYWFAGQFRAPEVRVVSLYVAQPGADDLAQERAEQFGVMLSSTIAGALLRGSNELNVDGVLILAVDGNYPTNEGGQTLYPRHDFYRQVCRVFQQSRRTVPVFVAGALSYEWEKAAWMVQESRRGNFPLLAGTYMPWTWRLPPYSLEPGTPLSEALVVAWEPNESAEFRALEILQTFLERRSGGETGVQQVLHWCEEELWEAGDRGEWSWELLEAALSRSDTPQGNAVRDGRPENLIATGAVQRLAERPYGFGICYNDGTRGNVLVLPGVVRDVLLALRTPEGSASTQIFLSPAPNLGHFAALTNVLEQFFTTGQPPAPPERALLLAGLAETCRKLRATGATHADTPDLTDLRYSPTQSDRFADRSSPLGSH